MIDPQCTCGPYWSVVPPGPCPTHQPLLWMEYDIVRRYRMATTRTTATTNHIVINGLAGVERVADFVARALENGPG